MHTSFEKSVLFYQERIFMKVQSASKTLIGDGGLNIHFINRMYDLLTAST